MNFNNKKNEERFPIAEQSEIIEKTLESYGIKVRVAEVDKLPNDSVLYKLEIQVGTVISDIEKRKRELALALASSTGTIKIQAPIPGRALIGITVPKMKKIKEIPKIEEYPATILGKFINFIANIFGIISVILSYTVGAFEKRKDIAAQLLVIIVVPIVITFALGDKYDILKVLDYYVVLFITWILILGIQQKHNDNIEENKKTQNRF